jgi:7SK snRNA methylphosphate capping enzyme
VGESLEDHRIPHFRAEWFQGKKCVDIGCNEGLVSLSIAVQFHPVHPKP